ncbi:MAG TPA: hypothetical protein V6D29_16025 [Leptolyngbyaceae cyanobacterium]
MSFDPEDILRYLRDIYNDIGLWIEPALKLVGRCITLDNSALYNSTYSKL